MKLTLVRTNFTNVATVGELSVDGEFQCFTLEDVVREGPKVMHETAIPAGIYTVEITYSNRFKRDLPLLRAVPGFEGIRIHAGNTAADTSGCILVGVTKGSNLIGSSVKAFDPLYAKLVAAWDRNEDISIEIM